MSPRPRRSEAAAKASRRNGARSKGPASAGGKATAARNATKHGLFSSGNADLRGSLNARLVADALTSVMRADGQPQLLSAIEAAARLAQATALIACLNEQFNRLIFSDPVDDEDLYAVLQQLVRVGRYQRRFRGRRDRAIRSLIDRAER